MIDRAERARMMKAHSIRPRMLEYLARIGIRRLNDLAGADAGEIAMRIDSLLMRRHINALGIKALENLIDLADVSVSDHVVEDAASPSSVAKPARRGNGRGRL